MAPLGHDRPRGTPSIAPRQPIAVAVTNGRKGERGGVDGKDRFWLTVFTANGKGKDAVRALHPSYARFNTTAPTQEEVSRLGEAAARAKHLADRQIIKGVLVHRTEEEAFWTNYTGQTLPGHQHPKGAPSCMGNGKIARRWMPDRSAYVEIPCPGDQCQYRQPGQGARGPTRPPCGPLSCLVFQLRFENLPCLTASYTNRAHGGGAAFKGFFEDVSRQALELGVADVSLYGLPFLLEWVPRSDASKGTRWYEPRIALDLPPGMTLQSFLLRQADDRASLTVKQPLLLGHAPTVSQVMDAEIVEEHHDDGRAGNLGEPPPGAGLEWR